MIEAGVVVLAVNGDEWVKGVGFVVYWLCGRKDLEMRCVEVGSVGFYYLFSGRKQNILRSTQGSRSRTIHDLSQSFQASSKPFNHRKTTDTITCP